MNSSMIFEGIGGISDSHVAEFANIEKGKPAVRRKLALWLAPVAACLCVALGIILILKNSGSISNDPMPHENAGFPDSIVGNALTPPQIPLDWHASEGSIESIVSLEDGTEYREIYDSKQTVLELSDVLAEFNWTINVSKPNDEGISEDGDIILCCGDKMLSFWYNTNYVRYKSAQEEKWFLASVPVGENDLNSIAIELFNIIKNR